MLTRAAAALALVLAAGACDQSAQPKAVVTPTTATSTMSTASPGPAVGTPVASDIISSIAFTDVRQGFGAYSASVPGASSAHGAGVASTSDGGRTWTRLTPQDTFGSHDYLTDLTFATPTVGLVAVTEPSHNGSNPAPSFLYITHDGGHTWSIVPSIRGAVAILATPSSVWVLAQVPQDDRLQLWTSNNQITTWSETPTALNSNAPTLARVSASVAYDVDGGNIIETTNGGATWQTVGTQPSTMCFNNNDIDEHLTAPSTTSLWVACGGEPAAGNEPKAIYRSDDSGRTWTTEAEALIFNTGPAVGRITAGGYLFDGSFSALSSTTAYMALGRLGLIETSDGGRTWSSAIPTYADSTMLDVINPTTAVALINPGSFWSTTNGATWMPSS